MTSQEGAAVTAARQGEATATQRYGAVKSADRTVELLELLATGRRMSLTELHRALRYPKSSLFMLLQTLVARGWVDTDPDRSAYGLGVRALQAGASYLDHDPVVRAVVRTLERLRDELDATFFLARLDGPDVVHLANLPARHHPSSVPRIGRGVPAYGSAAGKMLLALRGWPEVDAMLPAPLAALTPRTVTSRPELRVQLDRIRTARVAVEREEAVPGVAGIAVPLPLREPAQDAIGCSVRLNRLTEPYASHLIDALRASAHRVTELPRLTPP
jgi:DNA-binding IclR family transcriptional regulator